MTLDPSRPAAPTWARLRSPWPLPHEAVALVWGLVFIVLLERMPVTYPRLALLLAYARFGASILAVAVPALLLSRWLRQRRGEAQSGRLQDEVLALVRLGGLLLPLLALHFVVKSFIHLLNPRVFDPQLMDFDRWLHLGISPSLFFTGLLDSPLVLHVLDLVYTGVYFLAVVGNIALLLVLRSPARRLAFAAALAFLWMAGLVLYVALPSWGPVFIVPDVFEATLQHMPGTVRVQSVLFQEITSLVSHPLAPRTVRFGCVAAMPSLHVAVTTLFALATRGAPGALGRAWSRTNLALLVVMVVGSVVTGYHYLVDAWAGMVLAGACWFLARRLHPDELLTLSDDQDPAGGAAASARTAASTASASRPSVGQSSRSTVSLAELSTR